MSKKTENNELHGMRHSMAHILATAMQELYPGVNFGVGPVIENGFYYDFGLKNPLTPEDLPKIEKKMHEIIKARQTFVQQELGIDEAIKYFEKLNQPFKVELLKDLKKHGTTVAKDIDRESLGIDDAEKITTVTLYSNGPFTDLCRGGHLENTGMAGAFKLTKVAGAYWRGDQSNDQMQRVYGVAFLDKDELNNYLRQQEEAEKRDHRKLGQQLDIFSQSDLVGAGLPLFTPRGTTIINSMMNFIREINNKDGYQEVRTGHTTRAQLYEVSGHAEKFGDDLFVVEAGEDKLALKPMNCPHHAQLFARGLHSYRDLPIKYAEFSTLHRNEIKGVLGGLTRVRALTQDDAHAFVRPDQVESEVLLVVNQIDTLMKTYGLEYRVRLSLWDPKNKSAYLGDEKVWEQAQATLRKIVDDNQIDYEAAEGEAAFYGPKLDVLAVDTIGREWQVGTIQLDFNQPERFDLSYIDEDSKKQRPVMIHRALNGTFERMLGILIEHYAGNFPVWLAPEQVRLMAINDSKKIVDKVYEMRDNLKSAGIRAEVDASAESVSKKIRSASLIKVPYAIVVGEKELDTGEVVPRVRKDLGDDPKPLKFEKFVEGVKQEIGSRASKTSL